MSTATLKTKAYQHIQERLYSGNWPRETAMSFNKLAKKIGMSCTPVREAVIQLESEGLLEQHPVWGIRPKQLGRADIEELFEIRMSLESGAARFAAEKITEEELQALRELLAQDRVRIKEFLRKFPNSGVPVDHPVSWAELAGSTGEWAFFPINVEFHTRLIAAARNDRIMKILSNLHLLTKLLRGLVILPGDTLSGHALREYRFHKKIFKALEKRDALSARDWMDRHLQNAKAYHLALHDLRERYKSLGVVLADEYSETTMSKAEQIETKVFGASLQEK